MQRLARVFEFQSCIAFVGSGASKDLNYPSWSELHPIFENPIGYQLPVQHVLAKDLGETQQAIQMAINELSLQDDSARRSYVESYLAPRFFVPVDQPKKIPPLKDVTGKLKNTELDRENHPIYALLELPIRRFLTTNYDTEIEDALVDTHGSAGWDPGKSFEQDDTGKMGIFAIALAQENRYMVFHCHGILKKEVERYKEQDKNSRRPKPQHFRSRLVLTDEDYNHWYLSREPDVFTLQRCLDLTLASNPILFIGYSLGDTDLLRILRRASLRSDSEHVASSCFLLLKEETKLSEPSPGPAPGHEALQPCDSSLQADAWSLMKQIKMGINLLPYCMQAKGTPSPGARPGAASLARELKELHTKCNQWRIRWRRQPRARLLGSASLGSLTLQANDPLFLPAHLGDDPWLQGIVAAFEQDMIVVLTGPAGTGKFIKACQLVHSDLLPSCEPLVFHSYHNEDVYKCRLRITKAIAEHNSNLKQPWQQGDRHLLVIIHGIDELIGAEPGKDPKPRNKADSRIVDDLLRWAAPGSGVRVLLTARAPFDVLAYGVEDCSRTIKVLSLTGDEQHRGAFSAEQIGIAPATYERLAWDLKRDPGGLLLAGRFIGSGGSLSQNTLLDDLLVALRAHSSELGTRVVRHVVRALDKEFRARKTEPKVGRPLESFLGYLSCFNTPVEEGVLLEALFCSEMHQKSLEKLDKSQKDAAGSFLASVLQEIIHLGLLQEIRNPKEAAAESKYVVMPLVRRYYREVQGETRTHSLSAEFGLHGILSRGPFNSPGKSGYAEHLFRHFAKLAFDRIAELQKGPVQAISSEHEEIRLFVRTLLDILRTNFACNSVPLWGKFRSYVDMLSITIDLLRNFAELTEQSWDPGAEPHWEATGPKAIAVASAEEMIFLYNELGLSYYHMGAIQDALSVWGIAFDWQHVIAERDADQGAMYAASLNMHLGMAYLQMGKMPIAAECFARAHRAAEVSGISDLKWRAKGMIGRVAQLRGSVKEGRQVYIGVAEQLHDLGNHRAESYFMRLSAAMEIHLGNLPKAERLARESKAIAASEHARDLVVFAAEVEARVFSNQKKEVQALRAYRIALKEAQEMDMASLQADILLGMADIQLHLGDPAAARSRALEALKLANENLLVVRQVRSLLVLGKAFDELGDTRLSQTTLHHAKTLAKECEFGLQEFQIDDALLGLKVGVHE